MKRKYLIGFGQTLLICAVMFMMGTAYASSGKVTRELEYRDIQIILDGEALELRDSSGEPVEPFLMNGTSYLPVRALAEAMGFQVTWDSAASTMYLTSPEAESEAWLLSLDPPTNQQEISETADAGQGETIASFMPEVSAKQIALNHAGLAESAVTDLRVKLESSGAGEYEVRFKSGGAVYGYNIDALSGEIINFSKES